MRFRIADADFRSYGLRVLEQVGKEVSAAADMEIVTPNYEGIRVRCTAPGEQGWFLIRLSLHDPVMVLNIESDVTGGTGQIETRVRRMLSAFDGLA